MPPPRLQQTHLYIERPFCRPGSSVPRKTQPKDSHVLLEIVNASCRPGSPVPRSGGRALQRPAHPSSPTRKRSSIVLLYIEYAPFAGLAARYHEMEAEVFNALLTLISDTAVLRDYQAAALAIVQVSAVLLCQSAHSSAHECCSVSVAVSKPTFLST
eukprot:scaffold303859_cov23-Tisochrysis_lutea.AAC.1